MNDPTPPDSHSIAPAGDEFSLRDIAFHSETAELYDREITEMYDIYHRYLLDPYLDYVARNATSSAAIDLGCGTGVIALRLAERGFHVLGVDHSAEMLEIARCKLAGRTVRGECTFERGDVRHLNVPDGSVDIATCQGVLHHLSEIEPCLREIKRVLRPGGFFYISEPCLDETPLKRTLTVLWRLLRAARRDAKEEHRPESIEEPISASDLVAALARLDLDFKMQFLTHLGPLRRRISNDRLYLWFVRLASFPWRTKRGDLLFIYGRKRDATAVPLGDGAEA